MVRHWYILWIILCCVACSPQALHEARHTVAQADSLRLEKRSYSDSISLAQAYRTLGKWQWFYADDYARAGYYYGRLLREKDNPVSAMQAFIGASHSRTFDYQLLGRIYSNMGSLCHMACAFPLAANMYGQSANMFLRAGDSTAYYYGLYNIAIELAEQGKRDSCFALTDSIKWYGSRTKDSVLMAYCYMTEAQAYLRCHLYDSAIISSHKSQCYYSFSLVKLQLAQAFSSLCIKDSSVFYALRVLAETSKLFEINNALYILTNDDETKDKSAIRQTAADRADTQKLLEIQQGKLSQAVQLLEQDLARKPNLNWLYAIVITLLFGALGVIVYRRVQRNKHALWTQKIEDMECRYSDLQTEKAKQLDHTCITLCASGDIRNILNWRNYDAMCDMIDRHFFLFASKLKQTHLLNEQEIRLCVLVLLNMSRNQMADILPYALNGIGKFKYRVAQKLGTDGKNLRNYLVCIAIDEPLKNTKPFCPHS